MPDRVEVTFTPLRKSGRVRMGTTVLNAARELGIAMEGPCNGAGTCGKDLVQVRKGGRLETVLACKTILEEDTEVIVPAHENGGVRIVEDFFPNDQGRRASVFTDNSRDAFSPSFGLALDIGTTTVVASLAGLDTGQIIGRSSTLNPLVYYGHDVMSRIKFSTSRGDGLPRMHGELISAVNLLVSVICSDHSIEKDSISRLMAAGNTTMQHIFLGKGIAGIGEYPYTAEILDRYDTDAGSLGIDMNGNGRVSVFPCISAYVGGDIVSGLVALDGHDADKPTLFIDIGTNGEMALLTEKGVVATSCAAGPCFEGMTISCGMRAGAGAIESVSLKNEVTVEVIGSGAPTGICGSGLLDLVSEMIRTGLVNSRGRLQGPDSADLLDVYRERLCQTDGKRSFRLSDGVTITQEDIRQVQLARAAIRTGVEFLLSESGLGYADLKNIIIAGGFGYHISRESLVTVGLIPVFPNAKLSFVGNSSLEGARRGLVDRDLMERASTVARETRVLELANVEGFEKRFVREMNF